MFVKCLLTGFLSLIFWTASISADQLPQNSNSLKPPFLALPQINSEKTICVNMIVKNESRVICRCLASIKPYIDYWVIVDTGSTDNTQNIIKDFMKDVPGELHERPWINFAHNRNQALEFAKGKADYVLIIDADEVLSFDPGFKLPDLNKDFYYIVTEFGGTNYGRVQLINNRLDWKWEGVLHETVNSTQARTVDTLVGVKNVVRTDGARSQDPRKFHKDAELLEKAMLDEPNSTRYQFYLAQSYRDAGELEPALKNYEKRIAMGGWDQEVYWSKLQVARLKEALKRPQDEVVNSYFEAFNYRPSRVEPLYGLATYYRSLDKFAEARDAGYRGLMVPPANDVLFVESYITEWGLLFEYSISTYWTGDFIESCMASRLLLANPKLPPSIRECVERNLVWIMSKIQEFHQNDLNVKSLRKIGT